MTDSPLTGAASFGHVRYQRLAVLIVALALGAMAVDHLMGSDPGLEDPPMFAIAVVAMAAIGAFLVRRVIPRAKSAADAGGRAALVCGVVAIVPGIATLWLGLPFVIAGAGLALGLHAREYRPSGRATAAIVVSTGALALASALHVVEAVDKLA